MLFRLYLMWTIATSAPPVKLHSECAVVKPDGQATVISCFAEDEWWPFEGTRWWVRVDGRFHRVDTFGFETNRGPIYQSPDGGQIIVFSTFRNTIDGGDCFDLVSGEVTGVDDEPTALKAKGWKKLEWKLVEEAKTGGKGG